MCSRTCSHKLTPGHLLECLSIDIKNRCFKFLFGIKLIKCLIVHNYGIKEKIYLKNLNIMKVYMEMIIKRRTHYFNIGGLCPPSEAI